MKLDCTQKKCIDAEKGNGSYTLMDVAAVVTIFEGLKPHTGSVPL